MSILQELENIRYRFVLDLIKKEELYDKKKAVITAEKAFKMCYERYLLMQEILLPLKKRLGERVDVTSISFVNGMQEDTSIVIKYVKDGNNYALALSNLEYADVSIVSTDVIAREESFINSNKKIIIDTFKNISDNSLDSDITIKSTSGKFIVRDTCDRFIIKDNEEKIFSIEGKYSEYEKNGNMFDSTKLTCNYPKLKAILSDCWNGLSLYQHLHIYENDLPVTLIKKLTNR